ncbi:hypothetical protein BAUCODRAFT_36689 [Baudoinia panamericana UAMH 10762]|uniref:Uncharacterized protein n=1 Tax=Baudoinia panamericana (strain UAMH 10762) TaxID=717646 RepID=M2N608_BAUPA|nr:uncharacterized protein BAUCODRAFT_36689 [Baudoinia panamericana UAMH 10762]EMC94215.1 hypothetical protein BAUCODRAFT_36689 [Baudoinia panamericana UAMH 10762]
MCPSKQNEAKLAPVRAVRVESGATGGAAMLTASRFQCLCQARFRRYTVAVISRAKAGSRPLTVDASLAFRRCEAISVERRASKTRHSPNESTV